MIVRMTSCAPVRALTSPTIQPITAPPAKAPMMQTTACSTIGRFTAYPSQVATTAPPIHWPAAPMLNIPARKATATDRPVRMSGVASNAVSDSG